MKRLAALVLVVGLTASGCASTFEALAMTPRRTQEALSDPVRRVHIAAQVGRVTSTAGVGIGCAIVLSPTVVGLLACPLVALAWDFLSYEYVLEPISKDRVSRGLPSLQGPYWETGPRADEGEFFIHCEKPTHTCRPAAP